MKYILSTLTLIALLDTGMASAQTKPVNLAQAMEAFFAEPRSR